MFLNNSTESGRSEMLHLTLWAGLIVMLARKVCLNGINSIQFYLYMTGGH